MSTLLQFMAWFVTIPIVLIAWSVIQFLGAIYVGEVAPTRWRHLAIWLPVAFLTLIAMRPYPAVEAKPLIVPASNHAAAMERLYLLEGSVHHSWCERLQGRKNVHPVSIGEAAAGGSSCPDCFSEGIHYGAE